MRLPTTRNRRRPPGSREPGVLAVLAEDVSVELGGRPILESVRLPVHAGPVLVLVGPNGAGKSTLLAALSGDVPLASGSVLLDGRPLTAYTSRELAMRRSVLPQQFALSFPFTVSEVVRMGRAPWAGTPAVEQDDAMVADAMDVADLEVYADRACTTLSGGERARVGLARVLAQQTGIMLLDEPTAALDLRHQELVFQVARERADRGVVVVAVVHDLNLAAAHADRVAVLSAGRLVADGAHRRC